MLIKMGKNTYVKNKYSNLLGKTIVAFTEDKEKPECKVECRGDGMTIEFKKEISTMDDAESMMIELHDLLLAAWTERESLRPKLSKTLSGH